MSVPLLLLVFLAVQLGMTRTYVFSSTCKYTLCIYLRTSLVSTGKGCMPNHLRRELATDNATRRGCTDTSACHHRNCVRGKQLVAAVDLPIISISTVHAGSRSQIVRLCDRHAKDCDRERTASCICMQGPSYMKLSSSKLKRATS